MKGPTFFVSNRGCTDYFFCMSRTTRPATVPASRPSYTLRVRLASNPGDDARTHSLSSAKGRHLKKTLTLPRAAMSMASIESWRFLKTEAIEHLKALDEKMRKRHTRRRNQLY